MSLSRLPIDDVLPQLIEALRGSGSAVIKAPTGAGKTTRVPPALLDAGLAEDGRIIVLEPRRVAARAAARRMAEERGGRVGDEIGYQIRFERRAGPKTRILIATEGILVRMLQDDPFLEGVGAIVFDEFHERSLHVDLALAMARRVQEEARPDLKLVVMSATLDPAPIAAWLGDCPIVVSEGRLFPVSIDYLQNTPTGWTEDVAANGVMRVLDETSGDVLVFLPGVGEIRRTGARLRERLGPGGPSIMALFGDLPAKEQDAVLAPSERRKIVLATNVAETSLTIPGIGVVVDTGLARVMRHNPSVGINRLELRRISRASSDQRAGRAGRLGPGRCLRLWTEREHRTMDADDEPEIMRVALAGPALELLAWGEPSLEGFGWYEAPPEAALERALGVLRRLGAIDERGVTPLGHKMVRWPVHPRLARVILEAHRLGHPEAGAAMAAMLSERDPFVRDASVTAGSTARSDVVERLLVLRRGSKGRADKRLHPGALHTYERSQTQLARVARKVLGASKKSEVGLDEALGRALLAGFPDRLARRRDPGSPRALMVGGKGVELSRTSAVRDAALFVCVEMDAGGGARGARAEARVRQASAVDRDWLRGGTRKAVRVVFDAEHGRVSALEEVLWDDLVLSARPTKLPKGPEAAQMLVEAAMEDPDRLAGLGEGPQAALLARIRSLAQWMPGLELPDFEGDGLRALLLSGAQGRRSLDGLRRADWVGLIQGALSWPQRQAVEREAPERIKVPSGNQIRLQYTPGSPPVLAVRIQEMFGMADTPRVAGGRVPVLLHLLAPNRRPQQVTRDLRSFWDTAYGEVRKELRQRYPKHAWPEDPWTAKAEKKPRRKRRPK